MRSGEGVRRINVPCESSKSRPRCGPREELGKVRKRSNGFESALLKLTTMQLRRISVNRNVNIGPHEQCIRFEITRDLH